MRVIRHPKFFWPLLTSAALLCTQAAYGGNSYFRIINAAGSTELKETITADEARRGYEIVSENGRILEVVAPELSAEDFAALSEAEQQARRDKEEREREAEYNLSLLLKYSSIDDLEAEKRRKLSEFDINISILNGNLTVLRENADRERSRAAELERNGRAVPEKLQLHIAEIEREMNETLASIEARREEKAAVGEHYAADALRLDNLLAQRR